MSGINIDGKAVNVKRSSFHNRKGGVVSVSGSGSLATVTVQFPLAAGTNSVQANDAQAVFQPRRCNSRKHEVSTDSRTEHFVTTLQY